MAHAEKSPVRFERVYDGPVEDLWALWTTKEGFEAWFAPGGCRLEVATFDLREGGEFELVMTAVDADALAYMDDAGRSHVTRARGRFGEIRPHERLQMRFTMDFLPGVEPYPYDIVVEFYPEGERVRMVVTADAHPDAEMTRLAAQTLEGQLRVFESSLMARRGLTGLLTFGLNLTLDGCYDHRVGVADDELHDHFTQLMDAAGAMLWGPRHVRAHGRRLAGGGARRKRAARHARVGGQAGGQAEVRGLDHAPRLLVEKHYPPRRGFT